MSCKLHFFKVHNATTYDSLAGHFSVHLKADELKPDDHSVLGSINVIFYMNLIFFLNQTIFFMVLFLGNLSTEIHHHCPMSAFLPQ